MSKPWKPGRQTVELRPSRIRRDPVRLAKVEATPPSPEQEVSTAVAGVLLFAFACAALVLGFSDITSYGNAATPGPARTAQFGYCANHKTPGCVLDGDTIYVGRKRVEIAGLDAPQISDAQCALEESRGVDAAVRLLALLNSGKVNVSSTFHDQFGRAVRKVEVDGRDVATAMISAGVAREYGGGRRSWCRQSL